MSDFTEKQEAFCEEYVKDFNGALCAPKLIGFDKFGTSKKATK